MADEGLKQKLAAILKADVKDYSRLMSQDRVGTIDALKSHRDLFSGFVRQYGGRVIDDPGDEILASFESVSDTINCAVKIQREISERNAEVPSARMMQWRIGISLGEITEEEDRIYGDGVNVAARVESLAEPGGICVSGTVYDQIQDKLGLGFGSQGEQLVKNMSEPIRIYHYISGSESEANEHRKDPLSPEKPSIAVLPFENMSSDPEQKYFSDGIAQEILTGLSKNSGLIVKPRVTSFSSQIGGKDARTIGKLIDASHILEGSVRKVGNRLRITAQLMEASEDALIWSEQYNRELTDVFEIQEEIGRAILTELKVYLTHSDSTSVRTTDLDAYDAYLLGHFHFNRHQIEMAIESFERAVKLDPGYAEAHGAMSMLHSAYLWFGMEEPQEKRETVQDYMNRALSLNSQQFEALIVRSQLLFYVSHRYQDSIDVFSHLLQKYPNDFNAFMNCSFALQALGQDNLVLDLTRRMVQPAPLEPRSYMRLGEALLAGGFVAEGRKVLDRMDRMGLAMPVLPALAAFRERDAKAIKTLLDRGPSGWGNWQNWHSVYEAVISYLENGHEAAKRTLTSLWPSKSYMSFHMKSFMASIEGNLDKAISLYSEALSVCEYRAFLDIHTPWFSVLYPDYRSHPKYQKMLKDVGLDEESVAKLKILPLPF